VKSSAAKAGGGRRRRWWRRVLVAAVLLPLILFGLSNLWLATPPGRSWIAGRVSKSIGLPARVGPGSWLPWDGLCLRNIVIERPAALAGEKPEPILTVVRLKVAPHWEELTRGHIAVGRIEVDEPMLDLPVELLAHLVATPTAAEVPTAQLADPEELPEQVSPVDTELVEQPAEPPEAPATEADPDSGPPVAVVLPETSWLVVRGAGIRVRSAAGGGDWLSIGQIDAELPLRGKAADGVVAMQQLALAGWQTESLDLPVRWEAPRLSVTDWEPEAVPLKLRVNMQCVLFGSLPFAIDCRLPNQAVDGESFGLPLDFSAREVAGFGRLAGHLRMPLTIVGRGGIEAKEVEASTGVPGQEALKFDNCRLWWQASGGVARVIDARAVGDRFSLLGNAVVVADGRIGGVVRIVVPQDAVGGVEKMLGGLLADPPVGFRPLQTPDRWNVDCTLAGTIGSELFRAGDGPWRPMSEVAPVLRGLLPGEVDR